MNPSNHPGDRSPSEDGLPPGAHPGDKTGMQARREYGDYLTTDEAAAYLRRSRSFILNRSDISYLKGSPNTYAKRDLDEWFDRNKTQVR